MPRSFSVVGSMARSRPCRFLAEGGVDWEQRFVDSVVLPWSTCAMIATAPRSGACGPPIPSRPPARGRPADQPGRDRTRAEVGRSVPRRLSRRRTASSVQCRQRGIAARISSAARRMNQHAGGTPTDRSAVLWITSGCFSPHFPLALPLPGHCPIVIFSFIFITLHHESQERRRIDAQAALNGTGNQCE